MIASSVQSIPTVLTTNVNVEKVTSVVGMSNVNVSIFSKSKSIITTFKHDMGVYGTEKESENIRKEEQK